jgi:serine/threonine-protein kinase
MSAKGQDQLFPRNRGEPRLPGVGELVLGKYRVESRLGAGGMGAVFAARHEQLGQVVALKVLNPAATDDPESVVRFMREAQSAGSLDSEHVVRVFDVGALADGTPVMVMERLVGRDLSDLLERRGALDVSLAVECVYQAAVGVADAHEAGIIHRDLKPSNLFVMRRRDGAPLVKVLDFGISKALDPDGQSVRLTQTRTIVGSPLYMSPEQVRDARRVDARSDVWSLGVILQELLTGHPPFDGDSLPSVCARIIADPPTPIVREDVPRELLAVVERSLQKDPSQRYQTAHAFCEALRPLRAPVVADLAELGVHSSARASIAGTSAASTVIDSAVGLVDTPHPVSGSGPVHARPKLPSQGDTRVSGTPDPRNTGNTERFGDSVSGLRSSTTLNAQTEASSASGSRWLRLGVPIAGAALVAATLAVLTLRGGEPAPVATAVPSLAPPPVNSAAPIFVLRLVSTPPGAEVVDGEVALGKTPLVLPAPGERARRLELRLLGYRPYQVEQRPLERDAEIYVELVPEPPAAPATQASAVTPAPTPPKKTVVAPKKATRPAAPAKPVEPPKPPPSDDIRMKR